jgi:type II secretory pathway pseudopilin PulG
VRRAFTLIELLVIIAIVGVMVFATAVSATGKTDAARLRGATRDIFAMLRRARSTALMTQQPVIVSYSSESDDGEVVTKVDITSSRLMAGIPSRGEIQKLTGGYLVSDEPENTDPADDDSESLSVEDWLFEPLPVDVVKGVNIKVITSEDELENVQTTTSRRRNISTWSNTDFLIEKYKKAREDGAAKKTQDTALAPAASETEEAKSLSEESLQEKVSVVWESNGRVKAHEIKVFLAGSTIDDALTIKVDRFGSVKILPKGGQEE